MFHLVANVYHMEHPEAVSANISRAIAAALTEAGISLRSAADTTGIPVATLSRRLNGTTPFTTTELARMASVLGVAVSDLVSGAESDGALAS